MRRSLHSNRLKNICTLWVRTLDAHPVPGYGPPCTAHVRASSRGVWLAEQAWRPRPCLANRRSGSPRGYRPPLLRRAALSWLERGRERGWRKPSGTWEGLSPSVLAPEARSRGGRRHPWSAGRRACRKARGAFAKVPLATERLTGAPHPHACEGKEIKAPPRASALQGPMAHASNSTNASRSTLKIKSAMSARSRRESSLPARSGCRIWMEDRAASPLSRVRERVASECEPGEGSCFRNV